MNKIFYHYLLIMARGKTRSKNKAKRQSKRQTRKRSKKTNTSHSHDHDHDHTTDFSALNCAPNNGRSVSQSCYSDKSLLKIRNLWNARHPDRLINETKPEKVWVQLKELMGSCCENEAGWLKHNFMRHNLDDELVNYTFAPASPEDWKTDPYEWLSSMDIQNVMKQYENVYPFYRFIGPSPIDYDTHIMYDECVWEELCEFDLKKHIKDGKTHIGVVFNLDPHYEEGSHWVALMIDIPKSKIYYFDSYGEPAEPQIMKFMKEVVSQMKANGKRGKIIENKRRFQYSDGECGIYSIYFILEMLKNKKFKSFRDLKMSDDKMKCLRRKYFNYDLTLRG